MLRMNQIDQIKELQRQGLGSQEIAGRLNLDRKTVAKYMRLDDFNAQAGIKRAVVSKLDPWKSKIGRHVNLNSSHTLERLGSNGLRTYTANLLQAKLIYNFIRSAPAVGLS